MAIQIGAARSVRDPEGYKVTPDDRQTLKQTIGGVIIQDFGRVEDGDTISFSAVFDATNWALVKGYWTNRTKLTMTAPNGEVYTNCRVVIKDYTHVDKFKTKTKANIEIWRA